MKTEARRTKRILIVCSLAGVLLATTAPAATVNLYDFPWASGGAWQEGSGGISQVAQTFTTGNDALTLSSAEIWIRNARYPDDDDSSAGTLSISLYGTDSGNGYRPTGSALYTIVSGQSISEWYDNGPGAGNGTDYTGLNYACQPTPPMRSFSCHPAAIRSVGNTQARDRPLPTYLDRRHFTTGMEWYELGRRRPG